MEELSTVGAQHTWPTPFPCPLHRESGQGLAFGICHPEMFPLRVPPPGFSESPSPLPPPLGITPISGAPAAAPHRTGAQDRWKGDRREHREQEGIVEHRGKSPLMTTGQSLLSGPCSLICREGNSQNALREEKVGVGCVLNLHILMGMIPRSGMEIWGYSGSIRDLR